MQKPLLFSPGPVLVTDRVRNSLLHHDICHRSPDFESLFRDTQEKVRRLFLADESYYALLVSGSGTAANETCLSSLFASGEAVCLISNGVFGERLENIIDRHGIEKVLVRPEWAELPDPAVVDRALGENPHVTVVAMVYHETSTGMINPVTEIGAVAERYGKTFFVDCVSAAGGEYIDAGKSHIDICTSVAGKCLGGFPGSAYILARESLLKRIPADRARTEYLNLANHYIMAKKSAQTPNTPNVTLFFALNEALTDAIEGEGIENRVARYRACAARLRTNMRKMGLRFLIPEEQMGNTVTSVFLPEGRDLHAFLSDMEERGYILYPGKGKYEQMGMFQVANMGDIHLNDCERFLNTLEAVLKAE